MDDVRLPPERNDQPPLELPEEARGDAWMVASLATERASSSPARLDGAKLDASSPLTISPSSSAREREANRVMYSETRRRPAAGSV